MLQSVFATRMSKHTVGIVEVRSRRVLPQAIRASVKATALRRSRLQTRAGHDGTDFSQKAILPDAHYMTH
jgi:hypothetical protein